MPAGRLIDQLPDTLRELHQADRVELIETHISWVLLAGEHAYKVKKPLDLGFLDFSTLDKRRACCEEELRLNRRTAPDLYLDVVPITGSAEHPRVGGAGTAIEYAVRMRRFPQEQLADRVAQRGALAAAEVDAIARAIAQFHSRIEPAAPDSAFGAPEHVQAPVMQNFDQIEARISDRADVARLEKLRGWSAAEFARIRPLLVERKRAGCARECHGDLHLGNIVLTESGPVPFDCIEFNPELRWIDVMNEIAFLVMDLFDHRLPGFAWRALNAYLESTGDYAGVGVLRYYLVYRAMVRAKVATIRAHQADLDEQRRAASQGEYRGYLALAEKLAGERAPAVVLMHGLSGSGKTTVAQVLLERLGAIRVRSDIERKRLHGLAADERTGAAPGAGIYGEQATQATYERLAGACRAIVAAGYAAIVDAAFLKRAERERFRALADSLQAKFAIVTCRADEALLRERLTRRAQEARDASEADAKIMALQREWAEPLTEEEQQCAVAVDSARGGKGIEEAVEALRRRLSTALR
jgi:aminoglycoside phosphotransferase family enzyme/predicted kinase